MSNLMILAWGFWMFICGFGSCFFWAQLTLRKLRNENNGLSTALNCATDTICNQSQEIVTLLVKAVENEANYIN